MKRLELLRKQADCFRSLNLHWEEERGIELSIHRYPVTLSKELGGRLVPLTCM